MNNVVKTAALVAFAVVFSMFSSKPLAAVDFSKAVGKVTNDALKSVTNSAVKVANNAIEPKGPVKEITVTGIPSEYEGYYAMVIAAIPEDPMNTCMPHYLTVGSEAAVLDSVKAGVVKVYTPCDDKKRLITVTFSKTKDEKNTSAAGFIYAKDAVDACKTKAKMPTYKLLASQTFKFSDFMANETCKKIADGISKAKK